MVRIFHSILEHQSVILEIGPCEGCSYFPLPTELKHPKKGLRKKDNKCFRWCSVRYLNPVKKSSKNVINVGREFSKQLNFNPNQPRLF